MPNVQIGQYCPMSEVRKLIQLSPSTFAISLPKRYAEHLKAKKGDYLEVSLWDEGTLAISKLDLQKKQ